MSTHTSRHLISIDDLDRSAIERILDRAESFAEVSGREIKKVPALRGRTIVNLFYEASTRTSSSFELAAKRLSADVVSIRSAGSSVVKGESLKDTVQTLSAYDPAAIVIRSPHAGAAQLVAGWTPAAVVNAGDGKHEHPTQALLDVFTLRRRLQSLDDLNIWIVGDVLHSRVARSDILAFDRMGARVTVCGPPTLIPREIETLGCQATPTPRTHPRGRRRLRPADAERADDRVVCPLAARVRRALSDQRRAPAPRPAGDASRPGQPGRGAVRGDDRLAPGPDRSPGQGRRRGSDGGPLRAAGRLADARGGRLMSRSNDSHSGANPRLFAPERPAAELLVRGAHVLDPRTGIDEPHDVLIRDGHIAELGAPDSLGADGAINTIQAAGRHLFPGFVDPHVHLRTPGQEYKETIATGTAAAAAGGFCALVAMPNTLPTVDTAAVLGSLVQQARTEAGVPVGFLASITRGLDGDELTEMAELRDAGALGFTDDGKPVVSAGMLRKALQYQRLSGGVIALHEEDPALSGTGVMHEGAVSARLGMTGIPSISESTMIARDASIALYEGARVHFQHLSCVESVRAVAAAKEAGARVSAEVCPHHLTLTDDVVRTLDSRFKMNPPLRTESDRRALIEGIQSGVIDCIATDHAPHASHEKEVPFEQAPMGTTGLETAFAALYTELVLSSELELETIVRRLSDGAALYGLPTPRIAVGAPANVCLVNLDARWEVGARGYASRSTNSCFSGRTLQGRVELTLAAGVVAYRAAMLADAGTLSNR